MTPTRRIDRAGKQALPLLAVLLAFSIAFILPTALRPPPDQANASGAINPDAPPQDNTQFVEAQQEASGGGAGSSGTSPSTTVPVTVPKTPSIGYCYGSPPRQIPSVYSGPCVGAWKGNNGGATAKNVFPNEVRVAIQGTGAPGEGRLQEAKDNNAQTNADTKTWQALEEYFNKHFQFYGRRMKFYGMASASSDDDTAENEQLATKTAEEFKAFAMHNTVVGACQAAMRKGVIAFCDPMSRADNAKFAPYAYSKFMDLDEGIGFGAEFVCKLLLNRNAKFGGGDVNGKPRKYGYIGYHNAKGGIDASVFKATLQKECGADVEVSTLSSATDAQGALAATTRFRADGVTTIIFYNQGVNVLLAMQQADNIGYQPEWVMMGAYAVDTNLIGTLWPKNQARHLIGTSTSEELPLPTETRECVQAIREIDPSFSPSKGICLQFWEQIVHTMDGLQGAGPNLTPQTFEKALFALGHQFGQTNWNFGGGYGPDDRGFIDDVSLVWWDSSAQNLDDGTPGAYVWIRNGKRFQRSQLPTDDSEFFKSGVSFAPAPVAYR